MGKYKSCSKPLTSYVYMIWFDMRFHYSFHYCGSLMHGLCRSFVPWSFQQQKFSCFGSFLDGSRSPEFPCRNSRLKLKKILGTKSGWWSWTIDNAHHIPENSHDIATKNHSMGAFLRDTLWLWITCAPGTPHCEVHVRFHMVQHGPWFFGHRPCIIQHIIECMLNRHW